MKPGLAVLRINCTVTASQIKKNPKEEKIILKKIVTYRLIMFCIFLGREFEEKGFQDFCYKKLMVIYWELCGSIYIVFY